MPCAPVWPSSCSNCLKTNQKLFRPVRTSNQGQCHTGKRVMAVSIPTSAYGNVCGVNTVPNWTVLLSWSLTGLNNFWSVEKLDLLKGPTSPLMPLSSGWFLPVLDEITPLWQSCMIPIYSIFVGYQKHVVHLGFFSVGYWSSYCLYCFCGQQSNMVCLQILPKYLCKRRFTICFHELKRLQKHPPACFCHRSLPGHYSPDRIDPCKKVKCYCPFYTDARYAPINDY